MFRFAALALVLIVLAGGCSQPEAPTDPASAALDQLRTHNYDEAIRLATEAIQQSPSSAAAYQYRGRAYYYRAAMGDAHRAIEDLGAAIRLAPESSEGYYYRALVYRDLGQTELAENDDVRARELDLTVKGIFEQLPDSSNTLTKLKPISPEDLKSKSDPQKTSAEMLRESAAAEAKNRSQAASADVLGGSYSDGMEAEIPAPVESDLNKQYRALLGQGNPREGTSGAAGGSTKDAFGRPVDRAAATGQLDSQANTAAPLPSSENEPAASPSARGTANWGRTQVTPMQSPFTQRSPISNSTPGMLPTTQSPFPQASRPTGYVPPVSPFGAPGGQVSGTPGMNRPFSAPSTTTSRPQNNAVRPPFPRDYNP